MKIALATDHAGFELLRQLEAFLVGLGHQCVDFGPDKFNPLDDYPDFIIPAARAVAIGECEMGVILGGSGQGEAIAANRIVGIRCALFYGGPASSSGGVLGLEESSSSAPVDAYEVLRLSRQHNDANMLSLGARFLTVEQAKRALEVWLGTRFSAEQRHARRIAKIDQLTQATTDNQFVSPEVPSIPLEPSATDVQEGPHFETASPKQTAHNLPEPEAIAGDDGSLSIRHDS